MKNALCESWQNVRPVVIGVCHVPPLPGSPRFGGSVARLRAWVQRDAAALVEGGVHGLIVENFGDVPFFPRRVPAHVVAHMTIIAADLKRETGLPVGVNVLRNDGRSALAVAHAAGADFIRVNVLSHARVADQGVLEAIAHDLLRERAALDAAHIRIWADVNVKESTPLGQPLSIADEVADTLQRGLADAVIVSGANTGSGADLVQLQFAFAAAGAAPVFVGSGISAENVSAYLPYADGFIVGTSLKTDGVVGNPVDVARVRRLMARVGECGRTTKRSTRRRS